MHRTLDIGSAVVARLAHVSAGIAHFLSDASALIAATGKRAMAVNVPALAAAIAFHSLLSLAPLLLLVLTAASSILGREAAHARLIDAIDSLGDPAFKPALRATVDMIVGARGNTIATAVGVLIMVYFASAVFHELGGALNRIWDVPPRARVHVEQRLVSLVFVPAAVALGMILMAVTFLHALVAPIVSQLLPSAWVWTLGRAVIPFLLMTLLLALVYRYGPRTSVRWSDVGTGATLTALAFTGGNVLLGAMLRRSILSSLYGAAGAIVLLLLWIFYSAHFLLIGACFTREYARRHGVGEPESDA